MSCKNDYPKDIKLVRILKLLSKEWNKIYQHGANLLNKKCSSLFYSKLWETELNLLLRIECAAVVIFVEKGLYLPLYLIVYLKQWVQYRSQFADMRLNYRIAKILCLCKKKKS
jgi:hypothetical protein